MNTVRYAKNAFNQESESEDLNLHSVLNLQNMNNSFKISPESKLIFKIHK